MSKHQSCINCNYWFVGPDLDIGNNNCDGCMDELHGHCNYELQLAEIEIERLKKILMKHKG